MNKKIIFLTALLLILCLTFWIAIYNTLYVRHWKYAYYGKSADGNIQCELLFTTPTYENLRSYMYYRPYIKNPGVLGELWIKANNEGYGVYVSVNKDLKECIIKANGIIDSSTKWKRIRRIEHITAKEDFVKKSDSCDLDIVVSHTAPFSESRHILIRLKRVSVRRLPFMPKCDIHELMKQLQ